MLENSALKASSGVKRLLPFSEVRTLLLEDLQLQEKELLQHSQQLSDEALEISQHKQAFHHKSNYTVLVNAYRQLRKMREGIAKDKNVQHAETQSTGHPLDIGLLLSFLERFTKESPSQELDIINSDSMVRLARFCMLLLVKFLIVLPDTEEAVGEAASKVKEMLLDSSCQRPELSELMRMPTKRILFAYLSLLRVQMNPMKLHGCLEQLVKLVATTDLTNYSHFHKIYQILLTELTKICIMSFVGEAQPSRELTITLLEVHRIVMQFAYCLCLKDPSFNKLYFRLVIDLLAGCASQWFQLELIRRLVRVWEVDKPKDYVSEFLQVLFNVVSNSEQYKGQAVMIVNMLLNSNIDQLVVDNMHIIPYFEQIDESMRASLFAKCFPLAMRAIERKQNNVALSNLLVEWWVKMNGSDHPTTNTEEQFLRFFKEVISSLTESSIQMIYGMSDRKQRRVFIAYIARYLKLRRNFKQEIMNKFMLVESMKKLPTESAQFEHGLKSALELLTSMHESLREDSTTIYEFVQHIGNEATLRTIYNNRLSPLYYNSMNRIDKLYGREALQLLQAVFRTEAVLEDASASQRVKLLEEDIFMLINRNADLMEDVLTELSQLFRGLSNCTTTVLYLSAILYGSVCFLDVEKVDQSDSQLLELHISEFVKQMSSNVSIVYFTYSSEAFRLCLTLSLLKCNSPRVTEMLQQVLASWMKFTTFKELSMYYDSCKYEVGSEYIQDEFKNFQILQAKASKTRASNSFNLRKVLKPTEERLIGFLDVFRLVIMQEEGPNQCRGEMLLKPGYSNKCTFTYDMPLFKEVRDFPEFEVKISVFKRFVQVSQNMKQSRRYSTKMEVSQLPSAASRMEASKVQSVINKTEVLSNHRLFIRLPSYSYIVLISSSQVYTVVKKTGNDEKVMQSFTDRNPHFRTELTVRFDILGNRIQLELNRAPVCQLPCQLSQGCKQFEVEYEFNQQVALSRVRIKESADRYGFPLKSLLEIRGPYTLKLDHLKSAISLWTNAEYFELKYLLALMLHLTTSELSYPLTNTKNVLHRLFEIALLKFVQQPEPEQQQLLFDRLKELTRVLLKKTRNVDLSPLEKPLIREASKQGAGCNMTFEFISRVLLDFELWKDAAFTVQLAIVEMVSRIIDKGYHAKLPSNIHLTLFEQLMSVTFDSYKLEESYGGVKPAEKLLLKKTALDALIKLINYNGDRAVTHKQFCQCMGRICRAAESDNKLEQYLRDAILVAVKNILSPHYKENNKKYQVLEKEPIVEVFRLSEFRVIMKFLPVEMRLVFLDLLAMLLADVPDADASKLVRSIINSLKLDELEQASDTIISILAGEREKVERDAYRRSLTIIELLALESLHFHEQPEDKQELIITIMMIYFQSSGHTARSEQKEVQSLAGLFSRTGFVNMLVCMVQMEIKPNGQKMPKRKKLIEQIFRVVFCLPKNVYFTFAESYRQLGDQDLEVLEYLLSEAIANSNNTALPLHSVTLQFCFFCLVSLQQSFNEERLPFAQLIYAYVKTLVESERSMAYSAFPGFGYPTILSKMVLNSSPQDVQIRGGILFKVLIVLFKCIELLENPHIITYVLELFTTNLQRLEHYKDVRKLKSQRQQAFSDIFSSNKDFSSSEGNEIEELVKRMSLRYEQKYPQDKGLKEVCYSEDYSRGEVAHFCLDYVMLRLVVMSETQVLKPEIAREALNGFRRLTEYYPKIKLELEPSHQDILGYREFNNFMEAKESLVLSKALSSGSPQKTPQSQIFAGFGEHHHHQGNLFELKTPQKRLSSMQNGVPTRFGQEEQLPVSPKPAGFVRPRKVSVQIVSLDKLTQEEAKIKFKGQVLREAKRLLTLEYMFAFIAQRNHGRMLFVKDNIPEEELPSIPVTTSISLFVNGEATSSDLSMKHHNKMLAGWKAFVERCQLEDGLLWQRVHKKEPILEIRPIYIMNGTYPITELTTDYNYTIQKQEILNLTRRSTYLNYSFLRNNTSSIAISPEPQKKKEDKMDEPLMRMNSSQIAGESSQTNLFGSVISDEEPTSPYNKQNYDCQLITVRGSYFCNLKVDRQRWTLNIESSGKSRPDTQELRYGSPKDNILLKKTTVILNLTEITEVIVRKFNQIPGNSLEFFTNKNRSHYVMLYTAGHARQLLKIIKSSRLLNIECLIDNCQSYFKKRRFAERWAMGQISNFDYLMLLNKYSGRSFNDPNQYYVFPWVLSDYESKQLNLRDPAAYRRLDKPIGALNERKLERYMENEACQETEKFLYGSFFSTSLFVFFYLVRLEPYSTMARQLQNHNFDAADRLFLSIANTWSSVINQSNTSDIKELIPQFYYLPAFLLNNNSLNLGKTQEGVQVGNVGLPPWASCPNDFITKMRAALESDFVSSMLHSWIDMVFGVAQCNRKRLSVFHPRYYQENIKYEELQEEQIDPMISQITFFGQFPSRLFRKQHQKRAETNLRYLIGLDIDPRKLTMRREQLVLGQYIEHISLCYKRVVVCVNEARSLKYYQVDMTIEPFKRVQVDSKNAAKEMFAPYLSFEEERAQFLFLNTDLHSKILLKRFNIVRQYNKSVVSDRFIALCGRKGVHIYDMEGQEYLTWTHKPVIAVAFLSFGAVLVTRPFKLHRLNFLTKTCQQIPLAQQYDERIYHIQFLAVEDRLKESYVVAVNRRELLYLTRHHTMN